MKYEKEIMIFWGLGLELRTGLNEYVETSKYVVIDKEKLAQAIIDENKDAFDDDCDIESIVYNDTFKQLIKNISEIVEELYYNNQ